MKKFLALLLALVMVFSLVACGGSSDDTSAETESTDTTATGSEDTGSGDTELATQYTYSDDIYDQYKEMIEGCDPSTIKLGFIMVGDESEGYTVAHYYGIQTMCEMLGIDEASQVVIKWNVGEDESCYEAAVELVEAGCDVIFGNSFGFEDYLMQAAAEFPDVMFCHATGYQAASSGLANMSNYFVDVYQSRYVSGVVAGVKLLQMIESGEVDGSQEIPVGYVGAYSYAEVVSGYTAFYLGLMSVAGDYDVQLYVTYTGSWASESLEYDAAISLIDEQNCVIVSQHADTTGAPSACEERGVYCVGYNVSMNEAAPNYSLTSASLNWGAFYTYAAATLISGGTIDTDWTAGYAEGAVNITEINRNAFNSDEEYNEAVEKSNEAIQNLLDGSLYVFDSSKFTVNGETVTSTATDDLAGDYYGVEHFKTDGDVTYFAESEIGSAPAFAFRVDGITELNLVY
jgi:basic membrane protein A